MGVPLVNGGRAGLALIAANNLLIVIVDNANGTEKGLTKKTIPCAKKGECPKSHLRVVFAKLSLQEFVRVDRLTKKSGESAGSFRRKELPRH